MCIENLVFYAYFLGGWTTYDKLWCFLVGFLIMAIEWREREHEGADNEALNHLDTVNALRQCGLLKCFQTSSMRSETSLLQLLIGY